MHDAHQTRSDNQLSVPLLQQPGIAFCLLLIGSCAAGSAALFARISPMDPVITTFWRFAIATPFLTLVMLALPPKPDKLSAKYPTAAKDWLLVLFTGASFAVSQMLWFLGLEYTSVANATLLLSLTPLIAALILWLVFREVIGRRFWFGMLLAISGMAGLTYASTASPDNSLHGDILCVFAAIALSGYFIGLSRLRRRFQAMPVIALSAIACTLVMLVSVSLRGARILPETQFEWEVVIGLAVTSQVIGHGLMTYAVAYLPGRLAAASVLIQPIWATMLAWALLDEAVSLIALISGALILCGIYLSGDRAPRKRLNPKVTL
ncbi:MAG: hypothetical protein CL558_07095 [Alphaproteobacteria bacterium]|nr:hypothetical protein [Alphaproteobacteria bacterium]MAS47122.1 hypothetical protein [Alphaproteobacteria bacterium]MAX95217.1 hypothetical protein [Alphaproteobacteria bacterium]MBN53330.1 hypothetical protein [Alphaproteobacteria bacterium]OUT41346.1 MAG: hypothetical protein CBB62_03060 [Micavibrio sp. TMED2]|tara:strand:- start:18992 stop:19954 length:963 start_codon:yes stop_codon:yes gene_type:complete